jgi:L-ascorbate metabolism protein UlaG (beta-lactamase superfamily)
VGWGEKTTLHTHQGDISFEGFEVAHWGARWREHAEPHRGYNGYVIQRAGRKILFGGDTGFGDHFKALKEKGPFEFAIMPIGSYKPGQNSHCTPEEAVQMARDAGAEVLFPIHHGTFAFGKEDPGEPLQRLEQALCPSLIACRQVGETFTL